MDDLARDHEFEGEPTRLALFDFDGTLFRAPTEPAWWTEGHGAWHDDQRSLTPPVVADVAAPDLWIAQTVRAFREQQATPGTLCLVMTGRLRLPFEGRVRQLLAQAQIFPHKVRLAESEDTLTWKLARLTKLFGEYPNIQTIEAWDDNPEALEAFRELVLDQSRAFVGHQVTTRRPRALLPAPTTTTAAASNSMAEPSTVTVELISAAKRKALPNSKFALPSLRKYPIDTPERTRNAAARLEQNKGSLTTAQYRTARTRIARAAKQFGIDSQYNKEPEGKRVAGGRRHLRMRIGTDGSVSVSQVHHMTDGGMFAAPAIELADKGSKDPVWIQLAKTGTFKGHRNGPFALTAETFEQIKANFDATENHQIPIDFEHATEADPTDGEIAVTGAPAQGWIKELALRAGGNELWGLVEWGDIARAYIQKGQYKYFSPAIRFNSKDRVSGKPVGARMTSGALTNNPFLDGMMPLAARDFAAMPTTEAEEKSGWVWLDAEQTRDRRTLNDLSFNELRDLMDEWLRVKYPRTDLNAPCAWVSDVYDDQFVYEIAGKFYRCAYVLGPDNKLTCGEPQEVRKAYVPLTDRVELSADLLAYRLDEMMPAVRSALALDASANVEEMMARCARLRCMYDEAGNAHGMADGIDLGKLTAALRDLLKAPLTSSVYDMLDNLETLLDTLAGPEEEDDFDGGDAVPTAASPELATATDAANPDAQASPIPPAPASAAAAPPAVVASNARGAGQMETISLSDHQKRVKELEDEISTLTLKLQAADGQVTTLTTELTTLKTAETERKATEDKARVELAFNTYKNRDKFTDAHRPMLEAFLAKDREGFEKLYPMVQPGAADRLLTERITPRVPNTPPKNTRPVAADFQRQHKELTAKFQRERSCSYDEAFDLAYRELTTTTTMEG